MGLGLHRSFTFFLGDSDSLFMFHLLIRKKRNQMQNIRIDSFSSYDAMHIVLHIHMGIHIETKNTIMSLDSSDSSTQMMNTFV